MNHPMGPFTVIARAYRISPVVDLNDRTVIYMSSHLSASAAARRLATIIHGKSELAKECRASIGKDFAGQFLIICGDGSEHALNPFRALAGAELDA